MHRRHFATALVVSLALGTSLAVAGGAQAREEHKKEERKKGGGESFTQFPTLTATVNKANGGHGVLAVEANVDIPDTGLRTRAKQLQPVLRDAYVQFLVRYASSLGPSSVPNTDLIGQGLQQATDRVLGRQGAVLLLGSVLVN